MMDIHTFDAWTGAGVATAITALGGLLISILSWLHNRRRLEVASEFQERRQISDDRGDLFDDVRALLKDMAEDAHRAAGDREALLTNLRGLISEQVVVQDKKRHDLRDSLQVSLGELGRSVDRLGREAIRREDLALILQPLQSGFQHLTDRLDAMIERRRREE